MVGDLLYVWVFFLKGGVRNVKCVNLSESIQQVTNICHQWGGELGIRKSVV